jgi:hypothetical protein
MKNELTNLIPRDRRKAVDSLYTIRLWSVAILFLSFLVVSAVLLRIPLYIYQYQQVQTQKHDLEMLTSRLQASQGQSVTSRFKTLNDNIAYMSRLATSSQATAATAAILNVPHPGIVISGLSYSPSTKGTDGKMTLTGTAATRTSLHQYIDALSGQPYVKNVDLPISAYAKENDIPFTTTISGSLLP